MQLFLIYWLHSQLLFSWLQVLVTCPFRLSWSSPCWPFVWFTSLWFSPPYYYPSYLVIKWKSYHVTPLLKSFRDFLYLTVLLFTLWFHESPSECSDPAGLMKGKETERAGFWDSHYFFLLRSLTLSLLHIFYKILFE